MRFVYNLNPQHQLSITCGLCKHHTLLEVANLIAVVGGDTTAHEECLALRKAASVEAQYDNLSDALVARGMSDALKRLENSQLAWESDTKAYCNMLQDIAEPSFGLYAQDLESNCQSQRGAQRGEAIKLLYLALEQQQFEQWMPD